MKPLLTKLTAWKKIDDDEEFVDKAIDSLYKKLKCKQGAIEDLQRTLNNPTYPSKCITIPRSLDGRLQVSHRKGLPHVIYCRIFRWPDLQSHHELKASSYCAFPFASKQNEVCINPYHYERIDIPILPPVLVPKHVEFSSGHSLIHKNQHYKFNENQFEFNKEKENVYSNSPSNSNSFYNNNMNQIQQSTPLMEDQAQLSINNYKSNINYNYYYYNNDQSCKSFNNTNLNSSSSSACIDSPKNAFEESSESFTNFSPAASSSLNKNSNDRYAERNDPNWCSIVYYELNTRIGDIFHSPSNDIFVDGFTNPLSNFGRRFCLGMFTNVNRTTSIENCRKHIGRGIHIFYDNSDIYIECLSDSPIFIQSRNCNYDRGFHPNTVCKLLPGYSLRVFQSKLFAQLLKESINQGYDSVYELSNMCVIRISFVKGWGADYYRQDVSSCPCWIELRLNTPFQWLDKVLKEMGSSSNPVTSVS